MGQHPQFGCFTKLHLPGDSFGEISVLSLSTALPGAGTSSGGGSSDSILGQGTVVAREASIVMQLTAEEYHECFPPPDLALSEAVGMVEAQLHEKAVLQR